MYFPDLTPYTYGRSRVPGGVNVGWLDPGHDFERGVPPEGFENALLELCVLHAVNHMRGWHHIGFLPPGARYPYETSFQGKPAPLGDAEIRVAGLGGIVYIAPNLIYHYVHDLKYLPPAEFIAAVLR